MTLAELIAARRLEQVEPDEAVARAVLAEADRHLASAETILATDPDGAYALLYDAARKAVTAVMSARGLRATNRPGAHAAVVAFANAEMTGLGADDAIAAFDRLRRTRNHSEYGALPLGAQQVAADLGTVGEIVRAAGSALALG